MFNRTGTPFSKVIVLAGALAISQTALAGRVILNNDEWTLSNFGFAAATPATTTFAGNLASYMNVDGGDCNLLVYSSNFGLTGSSLNSALLAAGCSVSYSTGAFDAATLAAFDGVLLAGRQYSYNAATLTAYVNGGHSAYIAGGTASIGNEDAAWDLFTHGFGLDFGPSYNGKTGTLLVNGGHPIFDNVPYLYFNNGNTVSLFGSEADAAVFTAQNGTAGTPFGAFGIYDGTGDPRIDPQIDVPEPGSLALLALGLAGLGLSRRRSP